MSSRRFSRFLTLRLLCAEVRKKAMAAFPYSVVYTLIDDAVVVLAKA